MFACRLTVAPPPRTGEDAAGDEGADLFPIPSGVLSGFTTGAGVAPSGSTVSVDTSPLSSASYASARAPHATVASAAPFPAATLALAQSASSSASFDAWFAVASAPHFQPVSEPAPRLQLPSALWGHDTLPSSAQTSQSETDYLEQAAAAAHLWPAPALPQITAAAVQTERLPGLVRPQQPRPAGDAVCHPIVAPPEAPPATSDLARKARSESDRLIRAARAKATIDKYDSQLRSCLAFLAEARLPCVLPLAAEHVADWLAHLSSLGRAISTLESAVAAIRWAHVSAFLPDPTTSKRVHLTLEGAKRVNARPVQHHPCLPQPFLVALVESSVHSTSPHQLQLAAMVAVTFSTALRISELLSLCVSDLSLLPSSASVHVSSGKTDQLRVGCDRFIPALPNAASCPLAAIRRYLLAVGVQPHPHAHDPRPLWPNINAAGAPQWGGGPMSADSANRALKLAIKHSPIYLPPNDYSWHSIRVAAASTAARIGMPSDMIQRIGNWKSDSYKTYCDVGPAVMLSTAAGLWTEGAEPNLWPELAPPTATSLLPRAEQPALASAPYSSDLMPSPALSACSDVSSSQNQIGAPLPFSLPPTLPLSRVARHNVPIAAADVRSPTAHLTVARVSPLSNSPALCAPPPQRASQPIRQSSRSSTAPPPSLQRQQALRFQPAIARLDAYPLVFEFAPFPLHDGIAYQRSSGL